jgi:hypothetical protein
MQKRLVSQTVFALALCDKLMQEWEGCSFLPSDILSRTLETDDASAAVAHLCQMAEIAGVDFTSFPAAVRQP